MALLVTGNGKVVVSGGKMVIASPGTPAHTPLTFTAAGKGSIRLSKNGTLPTVQYKKNDGEWTDYTYGTGTASFIDVVAGDTLSWRGTESYFSSSSSNYGTFQFSDTDFACSGELNSLINYSNDVPTYCFARLFLGASHLTSVPTLPSGVLGTYAYFYCFSGSGITQPPVLPSTTLADYCYYYMFDDCKSLVSAPALPATSLANQCYRNMFAGCTSLTVAPALPATTLTEYCYYNMFARCSALTEAPALPATTAVYMCYMYMFNGCSNLVKVPALPATALGTACYRYMFQDCTNLQVSDTQTADAPYAWTIPASGTFTNTYSQSGMFTGCAGTRASNTMSGASGKSYTYYTQNPPVA